MQRILLRLRPKIVRQYYGGGGAAPPGPTAGPFPSSFFADLFLALELHLIPPPPSTTTTNPVSLSLPLIMTHCAEETPCDSASTWSRGQGHPVPGFHS